MRYAYIVDGVVHNFVSGPLEGVYHPDFIAQCVPCADPDVSENWVWDGEVFTPPAPVEPVATTLGEAKAIKLAAIQTEKSRVKDGGFLVDGTWFDSDDAAQIAYLQLAIRFQTEPTFSTLWKASAGVWITMNATVFSQVYAAGEVHIACCFAWQQDREAEVAAAQTVEEVQAVSETCGG